jgi:hypothetical protein
MMEVFLIQFLAAASGGLCIALADRLHQNGRVGWRVHSICVATSISIICLPVLAWTSSIFLGAGGLGQLAAGLLVVTIFFWVYLRLPKTGSDQDAEMGLPGRPSSDTVPPASSFHR